MKVFHHASPGRYIGFSAQSLVLCIFLTAAGSVCFGQQGFVTPQASDIIPSLPTMAEAGSPQPPAGQAQPSTGMAQRSGALSSGPVIQHVTESNQRIEMTVNTSRILTLGKRIPQININDPRLLGYNVLSPTQVQISARQPGVTQVNLWDEQGQVYTVDVLVQGDTRELSDLLANEFPTANLTVRAVASGVLISGYVENSDHIPRIQAIASEYYPRVVMNVQISGVHQVLLHVKIIEVSRSKLEAFGFDWWQNSSNGGLIAQNASNILGEFNYNTSPPVLGGNATMGLTVVDGLGTFYGVVEALCQDGMAKILAEPTLVTYNGRPAHFLAGGEVPVQSGGGLGVPTNIEYRDFGTQIDFVPIVLGNGRIRLEVRPSVSEIDEARSLGVNPAFKVRRAETGVEMKAGQTLAIAGILQTIIESEQRGFPFLSDVPYMGALFRHVEQRQNELELLIMVTPELVSAMDSDQVPPCGPGMDTTMPTTWELLTRGFIEVPNCCSHCYGQGCQVCNGKGYQGEVKAGEEPGMIGSPEVAAPELNPGVLTMSEIAGPSRSEPAGQARVRMQQPRTGLDRSSLMMQSQGRTAQPAGYTPTPVNSGYRTPAVAPTPEPVPSATTTSSTTWAPSLPDRSSISIRNLPPAEAPNTATANSVVGRRDVSSIGGASAASASQQPSSAETQGDSGQASMRNRLMSSFGAGHASSEQPGNANIAPKKDDRITPATYSEGVANPYAGGANVRASATMVTRDLPPAPMPGMMGPVGYDP